MTLRTILLAAAACAGLAAPASAATFVQSDSELLLKGFDAFDTSLGTLTGVSLTIDVYKLRSWLVIIPDGSPGITPIDWKVDGKWVMGDDASPFGTVSIALAGSGTSLVDMMAASADSYGYMEVAARGSGTLSLDPAQFIGRRNTFNGADQGFRGLLEDTSFAGPVTAGYNRLAGSCGLLNGTPSGATIEDYCGSTRFTLTYDYAAVPEPATWAMMLAGFAATGAAMRRTRRPAAV